MKHRNVICWLFFALTFLAGCSQGLDKDKFIDLRKGALAVNRSLKTDIRYEQLNESVSRLSDEISGLSSKRLSRREQELLGKYAALLAIYRDGLLLWKYKLEGSHYGFIPSGVIYVGQDVEPIVEKYRFLTESHVYGPTKQVWKSISGDSLQVVWDNARAQMAIIDAFSDN